MADAPDPVTVVRRAALAAAEHRWGDLAGCYAADATARTPRGDADGRDAVVALLRARHEPFDDVENRLVASAVDGGTVVVEWTWSGRQARAVTLPDGRRVEPTGNRVVTHGISVNEVVDGRIRALRQYWSDNGLADQLRR